MAIKAIKGTGPEPELVNITYTPTRQGRFQVKVRPRVKPGGRITWKLVDTKGVSRMTFWFPKGGLFVQREQNLTAADGWQITMTVKNDAAKGTYPYAMYLALAPDFEKTVGPLHVAGDQLAEGLSHPVIIVDP